MTIQDAPATCHKVIAGAAWICLSFAVLTICPIAARAQPQRDTVIVRSIVTSGPLKPGVPNHVEAHVRLVLASMPTGIAKFGVNDLSPTGVSLRQRIVTRRGVVDTIVRLDVIPVAWKASSGFYLLAAIGSEGQGDSWQAASRTRVPLPLSGDSNGTPARASRQSGTVNATSVAGSPSGDSLFVTLTSEELSVRRGVPTAFRFVIRARLQSAERAGLALGFNTDEATKFDSKMVRTLERGSVVHEERVMVTPVDWQPQAAFGAHVGIVRVSDRGERVGGPTLLSLRLPITVVP